jgi:hypothetical protein
MILTSLWYLGRGWTFDDCEEATAVSEDVCCVFFHEFICFGKMSFTQNMSWLPIHLKMQQHAVLNLLKLDSLVQLDQWMQLMSAMKGFNSGSDNFILLRSSTHLPGATILSLITNKEFCQQQLAILLPGMIKLSLLLMSGSWVFALANISLIWNLSFMKSKLMEQSSKGSTMVPGC